MKKRILLSVIVAFLTLPVLEVLQDRGTVPEDLLSCFLMGIAVGLVIHFTPFLFTKKKQQVPALQRAND